MSTDSPEVSLSQGDPAPALVHAAQVTAGAPAPSPAPSAVSTSSQARPSRPAYVPQFSAATEAILKRIRSGGGNNGSISPSLAAGTIEQSAYEDTKRRLVMTMNTSLSMPLATTTNSTTMPMPKDSARFSASSSNTLYLSSDARAAPAAAVQQPVKRGPGRPKGSGKGSSVGKPSKGTKRKRIKTEPGSDGARNSDGDETYQEQATPTTTKSGRQVLKPDSYNPATAGGPPKRKYYGKRTQEQALCKACTRGLSIANNQIVFCDGCNLCWHQLCHDPSISNNFVSDESLSWFCMNCMAKKQKQATKKKSVEVSKNVSWASKSADQKRGYLTSLPHGQLVNLIMHSLELHPHLPIFPAQESGGAKRGAHGIFAGSSTDGLFPRADAEASNVQEIGKKAPASKVTVIVTKQAQATREDSADSVPPAWPKAGHGVLAGLYMNEADMQDKNDFESFSVATYDPAGKKIMENGMPVADEETVVARAA